MRRQRGCGEGDAYGRKTASTGAGGRQESDQCRREDLSFITVSVVDKNGNPCPTVNDLVTFKVKGAGTYRAGANGDPASLDLFHLPQMYLFNGKLVAIVESTEEPGTITLEATARGLQKATINIQTK